MYLITHSLIYQTQTAFSNVKKYEVIKLIGTISNDLYNVFTGIILHNIQ